MKNKELTYGEVLCAIASGDAITSTEWDGMIKLNKDRKLVEIVDGKQYPLGTHELPEHGWEIVRL